MKHYWFIDPNKKLHFAICLVDKMTKISIFGLTFGHKRSGNSLAFASYWFPKTANSGYSTIPENAGVGWCPPPPSTVSVKAT